jgi:hypothetical protein
MRFLYVIKRFKSFYNASNGYVSLVVSLLSSASSWAASDGAGALFLLCEVRLAPTTVPAARARVCHPPHDSDHTKTATRGQCRWTGGSRGHPRVGVACAAECRRAQISRSRNSARRASEGREKEGSERREVSNRRRTQVRRVSAEKSDCSRVLCCGLLHSQLPPCCISYRTLASDHLCQHHHTTERCISTADCTIVIDLLHPPRSSTSLRAHATPRRSSLVKGPHQRDERLPSADALPEYEPCQLRTGGYHVRREHDRR